MKVIGGYLKGRKLYFDKTPKIRPTKNIVREAIFDILGDKIINGKVLDIFAGTGAVGIESISRGAEFVVFVENYPDALVLLKKNIRCLGIENKARIISLSMELASEDLLKYKNVFDVIFADPPYSYEKEDFEKLFRLSGGCVGNDGELIMETSSRRQMDKKLFGWTLVKEKKYGWSKIAIYRKEGL